MLKGKKQNAMTFNFKGRKIKVPGNFGTIDVVREYGLSRVDEAQIARTYRSVVELVVKPGERPDPVKPALGKQRSQHLMSIGLSEETLAVESELGEATRKAEQERIDQLMAEQQAEIDAALAEGRDPIAEKKAAKADRKPVVVPEKDVKEVNDVLGDAGAVEITGQAKDDLLGALLQPRKDAPVKEIKVPKKADKKADKKAKGKKGDGDGKADQ